MKTTTYLVPSALGFAICMGLCFAGCKKDEAPPPMPSASVAAAEPAAPLEIAPEEDAGPVDSGPDAAKVGGGGGYNKSLAKCCAALKQNAANAPAPTNTYMMTAAGVCDGLAAAGKDNAAAMAMLRGLLQGAAMPGGCQ